MKKIFMLLVSISLALVFTLTGCNVSSPLSFKNNFTNGAEAKENYVEKLTYSVNYDGEGKNYADLKKNTATDVYIGKDGFNYQGELVTTLTVGYIDDLPADIYSDILSEQNVKADKIQEIYIYETALNLTATYTFTDGNTKTVNDSIESKVYFLPASLSFAPIYSSYKAQMNLFSLTPSDTSKLVLNQYEYYTTYNLNNYTVQRSIISDGEKKEFPPINAEYIYKNVIDNNQLLFAVRNFDTNDETTVRLKVVSPTYNEPISISLSTHSLIDYATNFAPYNNASATLPARDFYMTVADEYARGSAHFFTIQKDISTDGKVASNALLLNYAQPLYDYGTMTCLGALVFTLSNVVING